MIQEEFDKFACMAFGRGLSEQQYVDLRRTFVAGAAAFLNLAMRELSLGDKPTEHDLNLIRAIQSELREFNEAVKRGEK